MKIKILNNCNLCGYENFKPIISVDKINIIKCENCGLKFLNPINNTNNYEEFYNGHTNFLDSYERGIEWRREIANQRINSIKKLINIKMGLKLLDIGCATGIFLEVAQRNNFESYGLDLSNTMVNYGKGKYPEIDFRCGDITQALYEEGLFDVVTVFDTLGYSEDPKKALEQIYKIIKPGGLLYMSNLNADILLYLYKDLYSFNYYFNKDNLQRYLSDIGFKNIRSKIICKNANLKHLHKWKKLYFNVPIINTFEKKMIYTTAIK